MKFNYQEHSLKSGIYKIINTHTNRIYIGQAQCFKNRWSDHRKSLLAGIHQNNFLKNDFAKCFLALGNHEFLEFHVLEVMAGSTKKQRNKREEEYIAQYWDKQDKCYNISKYANQPNADNKRKRLSTNEKIRQSMLGKVMPEEVRRKISASNIGKHHHAPLTTEQRSKLSASLKGRKVWNKGRKCSPEEVAEMSKRHLIYCSSNPKWIRKQSEARKGKKDSLATLKKKQSSSRTKKEIIAINTDTGEQRTFPSLKSAEETLNIRNSNIYRILSGTQKQAKGWTFKRPDSK